MRNIRVDPEELLDSAEELARISDQLRSLSEEIDLAASSAPSYDGQFEPAVRALGAEGIARLIAGSGDVAGLGDELRSIGQGFAEADLKAVEGLSGLGRFFRNLMEFLGLSSTEPGDIPASVLTPTPQPHPTPLPPIAATPPPNLAAQNPTTVSASYWHGHVEAELAAYQQFQGTRNDCAEFSVAAGLNLMLGTTFEGTDLAQMADEGAFIVPFMGLRMYPNGPTSPWQAANVVNEVARQGDLPVRGRAIKADADELLEYLRRSDVAPVVTIAWDAGEALIISRGVESPQPPPSDTLGAHAMLLVAHDPEHFDRKGNLKPWGFVNSWRDGGSALYWVSDADLNRGLGHPLLALANTVLIEDVSSLELDVLAPQPSPVPTPTPSPDAGPEPTSTPAPPGGD